MSATQIKITRRRRRILRVRKRIRGTPDRPRLAVARSNANIAAQIIDDTTGRTLCSASTLAKDVRQQIAYGGNAKAAALIGKLIGERARAAGIEAVCFDRRGLRYHGRLKALADAARQAGLKF